MDSWRREKPAKDRTLPASRSMGPSYTHSQMIPYSETYISNFNSRPAPKTTHSKSTRSWSFADPDARRQRRIASYKTYTAEGKIKASVQRSIRWVKNKYVELRYGLL